MTIKWNKKEAMKYLEELKDPFEEIPQNGKGLITGMAEKIKDLALKNKGIK